MRISTKGRYALRVMLGLAAHREIAFVPLRDISERQGISLKYLERIISSLNRAGFLKLARSVGRIRSCERSARLYRRRNTPRRRGESVSDDVHRG